MEDKMGNKKDHSRHTGVKYTFPLIVIMSFMFIFSGCLSYPGGYRGPVEPDSSGRMSRTKTYQGSIYYMDEISSYRGGKFAIRNDKGDVIFRVIGNLFSRNGRVTVTDMNGRALYDISRNSSQSKVLYRISSRGRWEAKVSKRRTNNYERYYVNSRNGKDYTVQGDFRNRLYEFIYRGHGVAQILKRNSLFANKYRIEIEPYQNTMVIILTTIIIDMENMIYPQR